MNPIQQSPGLVSSVDDTEKNVSAKSSRIDSGGLRTRNMLKQNLSGKPLVSVITVVFNGAATLEHNIQSVIGQAYDNVEHIVIDGGSSDGTTDILRKYDDHIDYWVSEKDAGIYDAMNKGIALANGEYIGMLNADDYFADALALGMIVRRLEENDVDAVFSCLDIVAPNNLDHVLRRYRISSFSPFMLRIGVMPPHPTFYCKKSCYEKAGPYRTDYRIAADFEMMVRLLLRYRITWSFIDEITVKMRVGGLSSSGIRSSWIVNREIIRACTENGLYTNMFMLALKLPIRLWERFL
jgi:glycosyltransferase involved in cell wall biosynthesis